MFAALGCVFDLDVAHPPYPIETSVPAKSHYHARSLSKPWFGFVWMNAPYEGRNGLQPWLDRFCEHGDGIALVPDRTSAPWFQEAWTRINLALFTFDKIKFIRQDGSVGKSPSNGTALMAIGSQGVEALHRAAACGLGFLAQPLSPSRLSPPDRLDGV
jgi:hypothetical protein